MENLYESLLYLVVLLAVLAVGAFAPTFVFIFKRPSARDSDLPAAVLWTRCCAGFVGGLVLAGHWLSNPPTAPAAIIIAYALAVAWAAWLFLTRIGGIDLVFALFALGYGINALNGDQLLAGVVAFALALTMGLIRVRAAWQDASN